MFQSMDLRYISGQTLQINPVLRNADQPCACCGARAARYIGDPSAFSLGKAYYSQEKNDYGDIVSIGLTHTGIQVGEEIHPEYQHDPEHDHLDEIKVDDHTVAYIRSTYRGREYRSTKSLSADSSYGQSSVLKPPSINAIYLGMWGIGGNTGNKTKANTLEGNNRFEALVNYLRGSKVPVLFIVTNQQKTVLNEYVDLFNLGDALMMKREGIFNLNYGPTGSGNPRLNWYVFNAEKF